MCAADLASNIRELGDPHAARALHQDVLQRNRRALGKDHPVSLLIASFLAADLRVLGHYGAAWKLDEDTLERSRLARDLAEEFGALRETQWPTQFPPQPGSLP
jgi:hypothetical protein